MNQSFFELRSKERIQEVMNEGLTSQAHYRSLNSKPSLISKFPKFVLGILGILGLIQICFQ